MTETTTVRAQPGSGIADRLAAKIESGNYQAAVVGMGYVGLPLAAAFCEAGIPTVGIDVSPQRVAELMAGRSCTPDVADPVVGRLVKSRKLTASSDYAALASADCISICVPTPLGKSKDPDISYIVDACDAMLPHLREGMLVVLESTTYPGTTRDVILPRFEAKGFKVGRDIFVAFSPERVDPGNKRFQIRNTPKVIGGITQACGELAVMHYRKAIEHVVPVSSAESAEMTKILENTFRAINIGLVNELAIVCEKLKLDVWEIIDAAATKPFGYMPFRPGPGLGGHCIPIDPLYLTWKMRTLNYKVRFIDLADEINSSMPEYVVRKAMSFMNEHGKAMKGLRVLALGVAYKKDVSDIRESPALDVIKDLREIGCVVSYADPHVPALSVRDVPVPRVECAPSGAAGFDLIIVLTDHADVDYEGYLRSGVPVLDTRNATGRFPGVGTVRKL
jgi:UDP-N-acetyl-D-glucosamine dehydrogenase